MSIAELSDGMFSDDDYENDEDDITRNPQDFVITTTIQIV